MDVQLNEIEVRVLGSLMEKEMATPEYYPLSLNALLNACNQKTSRWPVLALDERTVATALQSLKERKLVFQSDASRVPKYWQEFVKQHNLINSEAALLCLLLLRGPQTVGELRTRSDRLHDFATIDEASLCLEHLLEMGFITRLPLQPGRKEHRYAHLLAGEPDAGEAATARPEPVMLEVQAESARVSELEQRVSDLEEELAALKADFARFRSEFE